LKSSAFACWFRGGNIPEGFRDGDLLPPRNQQANAEDFKEFFGDPAMKGASELMMSLIQDFNGCAANIIERYNLQEEVKEFLEYVFSEDWIKIVEFGTKEEFKNELAIAINPLITKAMGITGR
jgi:hypothetical protein